MNTEFLRKPVATLNRHRGAAIGGAGGTAMGIAGVLALQWAQELPSAIDNAQEVPAIKQQVNSQYARFNALENELAEVKTKIAVLEDRQKRKDK